MATAKSKTTNKATKDTKSKAKTTAKKEKKEKAVVTVIETAAEQEIMDLVEDIKENEVVEEKVTESIEEANQEIETTYIPFAQVVEEVQEVAEIVQTTASTEEETSVSELETPKKEVVRTVTTNEIQPLKQVYPKRGNFGIVRNIKKHMKLNFGEWNGSTIG